MKVVTIIQARMGSTRLPGKVLKDLGGEAVLARVVNRVRRTKFAGEVVIATTNNSADDLIVAECRQINVSVFRGDEDDVLDRYYQCAQWAAADAVVRITSDCPLIDPDITDKTVRSFLDRRPDYASNTLERKYPRGLDTEVMTMEALATAWQDARESYQRAHVTPYIYENPERFRLLPVCGFRDYSHYRWTLDTSEDLALIRTLYERMDDRDDFSWLDLVKLLEQEPELADINRGITQKALAEG
jgi:spore coat polysaccharide biosynthesis protein SpsF